MYILISVKIFYTDDEDSGVPMTPALGDLIGIWTYLIIGGASYGYGLAATTSF